MALSRIGSAASILLLSAAPSWAQTGPPDEVGPPHQAVEAQQEEVHEAIFSCDRQQGDEIVVCGGRDAARAEARSPYRLPLPVERDAERAGAGQDRALGAGSDRCSAVGRAQQCNQGLRVIGRRF
ncbi:MAG TPA: hypothetical protein VF603_01220 [Allosphingosinicella sp.]|jgi:hypothetical protein